LLSRILVVDASKRATVQEIAQHPWMTKGGEGPLENYFPTRLPLSLPLDDEVIRGMTGFEFGAQDEIRRHLTTIIQSRAYIKASEQYLRSMESAMSAAIAEKSEKRKPFSLEFYKRKSSSQNGSWSDSNPASASSLNFEDPTIAYHPLLSIYYLVQEKLERDRQVAQSPATLPARHELGLTFPNIPVPEAAHTGDALYEIHSAPGKYAPRTTTSPSRARPRDRDGELPTTGMVEPIPLSPKARLLEELTGGKSLLRRISAKWSREPGKEVRKEQKTPIAQYTIPAVEIATPKKSFYARKSREIERFIPPSPQAPPPATMAGGLGRSTSASEADYRKRLGGSATDDESQGYVRRRRDWNAQSLPPPAQPIPISSPRTRSVGHARHATISAARRASARTEADAWSMSAPSTIPEESRDLSREASRIASADDRYTKPVHLKSLFSVATTSTKPAHKMRSDLLRVLTQLGISHEEIKGGFFCIHRPSIALESVQETTPRTPIEEYLPAKKSRRRLSLGQPIAAAAQFAGFGSSEKRGRHDADSDTSGESGADLPSGGNGREELPGPGGAMVVQFEIYIVKFPLLALHGIQFKRVGGDVWQYKNACVKILGELNW
jgi:serine/threonine protein kinase KIN1/2